MKCCRTECDRTICRYTKTSKSNISTTPQLRSLTLPFLISSQPCTITQFYTYPHLQIPHLQIRIKNTNLMPHPTFQDPNISVSKTLNTVLLDHTHKHHTPSLPSPRSFTHSVCTQVIIVVSCSRIRSSTLFRGLSNRSVYFPHLGGSTWRCAEGAKLYYFHVSLCRGR